MEQRQEGQITTEQLAEAAASEPRAGRVAEAAQQAPQGTTDDALLADNETSGFRMRWERIQVGFVDRPREAVQQADTLVAEVMRRLAETFADARGRLESEWSRGSDVGTEELRIALQRYRSFFELLLRH